LYVRLQAKVPKDDVEELCKIRQRILYRETDIRLKHFIFDFAELLDLTHDPFRNSSRRKQIERKFYRLFDSYLLCDMKTFSLCAIESIRYGKPFATKLR